MAPHFLGFRSRFLFLAILSRRLQVIGKQSRASAFKEITFPPGPASHAHIEAVAFPVTQSLNQFLLREAKAQGSREIVRSSQWQHAERNLALQRNETTCDLAYSAISARHHHQIDLLLQCFRHPSFLRRLINRLVPRSLQRLYQIFALMLLASGFWIVHQENAHHSTLVMDQQSALIVAGGGDPESEPDGQRASTTPATA